MTENVGEEWKRRFQAASSAYRSADEAVAGIPRFIESPWIQLLLKGADVKPGDRILEAGCASGKFSIALACIGCSVTALDYYEKMLENASDLKRRVEESYWPIDVSFAEGDIGRLPFPDNTFDLVFNEGVVEHWLDREERIHVIAEMLRVTKAGGSIAIFVPNGKHPLHWWWTLSRYPGYVMAPPMVRYCTRALEEELRLAGCVDVVTDGIGPYHTLSQWPDPKVLQYVSIAMNKFLPQPRWLRKRLGVHIFACGGKGISSLPASNNR